MARNEEINVKMREESRKIIINTSKDLFLKKGYLSVKIKDIADNAKISVGRIYWYFKSKEEILYEILKEGFDNQKKVLSNIEYIEGTNEEKLRALIINYLELCNTESDFYRILVTLMSEGGSELIRQLGFDTRTIGAEYHKTMYEILSSNEVPESMINSMTMIFFSVYFGMMLIYGEDFKLMQDEVFIDTMMRMFTI